MVRYYMFPDMPGMKRIYSDKQTTDHCLSAENEERSRSREYVNSELTAGQPLVNRHLFISGHVWHENGFQRQLSVSTLFSNQERRATIVPRINRGFFYASIYIRVSLFVLP